MRILEVPERWTRIVRVITDVSKDDLAPFLGDDELDEIARLRLPVRRLERAASRIAAKSLAVDASIVDDPRRLRFPKENEQPAVQIDGRNTSLRVSFSHSAGTGAAALHASPVGIDLERVRTIDPRATKFFLSVSELDDALRCGIDDALLHFWCAKEAAFKLQTIEPTLLRVPLALERATDGELTFRTASDGRVESIRLTNRIVAALALG